MSRSTQSCAAFRAHVVGVLVVVALGVPPVAHAQSPFTHTIPLKLPKAVHEFQPQLAVVYVPGSSNGILGVGWQLSGLSQIERVNQGNGIRYAGGDSYAHSELGLLVRQPDGSFRSRSESFSRFVAEGTCGDGPCTWTVHDPSGARRVYTATKAAPGQGARMWVLTRASDLFGNAWEVFYTEPSEREIQPTLIRYGLGNLWQGRYQINFNYSTRPDVEVGHARGVPEVLTARLASIEVAGLAGGVRTYGFEYQQSVATGRSQLVRVSELGTALPPQTFSWQGAGTQLPLTRWATRQGGWIGDQALFLPGDYDGDGRTDVGYAWNDAGFISMDVHRSSGAGFAQQRWATRQGGWIGGAAWRDWGIFLPGDFDGDAKMDVAYVFDDGGGRSLDVHASTGGAFTLERWGTRQGGWPGRTWTQSGTFIPGDFDGDGRSDIAWVFADAGALSIDVHLSTGAGFVLQRWATQQAAWLGGAEWSRWQTFVAGDFDGDGRTDIARVHDQGGPKSFDVHRSTGAGFAHERWGVAQGTWVGGRDWEHWSAFLPGDYNADGKTDIAYFSWDNGFRTAFVHVSTGATFERQAWADAQGAWVGGFDTRKWSTFLPGDFNGDGKTDVLYAWNDAGGRSVDAHVSSGSAFTLQRWATQQGAWVGGTEWPGVATFLAGDPDGDGRGDLVYVWKDGVSQTYDVSSPTGPLPDLMDGVSNGLGGLVRVEYRPAPQVPGAILPLSAGPGIPNTAPQPLVTRVTTFDGTVAGSFPLSYGYFDARVLPGPVSQARDLGFAATTVVEERTGQRTITSYHQTPGLEGHAHRIDALTGASQLVSRVDRVFELVSPSPGTELVRETSVTAEAWELGTFAFSQRTETSFDEFGNATVKRQTTSDPSLPEVTITTAYANDPVRWILGRVLAVKTTSGLTVLGETRNTWAGDLITVKEDWLDARNVWVQQRLGYDLSGRLVTVTEPGTGDTIFRRTTTAYDPTYGAVPVRITNAAGHVTTHGHDDQGLVTRVTDANGATTFTSYDRAGRKVLETRPDGGTTRYLYELYGNPAAQRNTTITSVDGIREIVRSEWFDGSGFVYLVMTTGDGGRNVCVQHVKDEAGRPRASTVPYDCANPGRLEFTSTEYDAAGRIARVTTPDGRSTVRGYGTNFETVTDANGQTTRRVFDARKRVVAVIDPAGQQTRYGYDALGRTTSVTLPDGSVTALTWDSLNRKTSTVDPKLGTTAYGYWATGMVRTIRAAGKTLSFEYDALNRLVSKQATGEPPVTWTYDDPAVANSIGRLTAVSHAGGTTRFAYRPDGLVRGIARTVDATTYSQFFTYDLAGRTTAITYPDGSRAEYAFTEGGNLASLSLDGSVVATWTGYDPAGRPARVQYANGVATSYGYDVMGHVTALQTSSATGALQDLAYDWYGLPNTGGLNLGAITDRRPSKLVAGANTDETQTYAYDALYRLTSANGVWGTKAWSYDSVGNPLAFGGVVSRTLAFDGQRVISGTGLSGVAYDAAGNMTAKTLDGAAWGYAWTAENRLAQVTRNGAVTAAMTYDADGIRVRKVFRPGTIDAVTTVYVGTYYERRTYADGSPERHTRHLWANGQLVASITRSGPVLTATRDDGLRSRNELLAASTYDAGSVAGLIGKARHLGAALLASPHAMRWAAGAAFAAFAAWLAFVLGTSLRGRRRVSSFSPRFRLASAVVLLAFSLQACTAAPDGGGAFDEAPLLAGDTTRGPRVGTFFHHRNHVNSGAVITDASGAEVSRLVYLPFGELAVANSAGADVATSKFTGQELDAETGLYAFPTRYYDPAIGRFLSADTGVPDVTDAQAHNRYSYAENNPIVFVDPTGHFLGGLVRFVSGVWNGIRSIVGAVITAVGWVVRAHVEVVRFQLRAAAIAGPLAAATVRNPAAMAGFLMGAAVLVATGNPLPLVLWAKATTAALAAQSLAMAAGVRNPTALSLIGAMAGSFANGPQSVTSLLKAGAEWGVRQGITKLEGNRLGALLGPANALAARSVVNASVAATGWVFSKLDPADPGEVVYYRSVQYAAAGSRIENTDPTANVPIGKTPFGASVSSNGDVGVSASFGTPMVAVTGSVQTNVYDFTDMSGSLTLDIGNFPGVPPLLSVGAEVRSDFLGFILQTPVAKMEVPVPAGVDSGDFFLKIQIMHDGPRRFACGFTGTCPP